MPHFIKDGNTINVLRDDALNVTRELPPINYALRQTETGGLVLEQIDAFKIPTKFYGNLEKRAKRIWNTFKSRPNATGVLLSGEKGSGKTLLAMNVADIGKQNNTPTILINTVVPPNSLNLFLQSIGQPCVIILDEFEKIFDDERGGQDGMLSLLDGAFSNQMLFILTCNDKYKINSNLINRPGRVFYAIEFNKLPEDAIIEYCEDKLKNKNHISKVCDAAKILAKFNFDQLKALVEEMNRYDEDVASALDMLNVTPEETYDKYDVVSVTRNGKEVQLAKSFTMEQSPMVMDERFYITVRVPADVPVIGDDDDWSNLGFDDNEDDNKATVTVPVVSKNIVVEKEHFLDLDSVQNTYTFKVGEFIVVFKRRQSHDFNYRKYLA